jgi:ATP-dependent DNA helicase RecG
MEINNTFIDELLDYGERVTLECKKSENSIPKSVWETYSAFANTNGGYIILGIEEDSTAEHVKDRFHIQGINNAEQQRKDFWNTINSDKVSSCLLKDEDVQLVEYDNETTLMVICVPQAIYRDKPIYISGNVYKGTFKRNHEGDYHCDESIVKAMIRDANEDGNDGNLIDYYTMDDIDMPTLKSYRNEFENRNIGHAYNQLDDIEFLKQFGAYTTDRSNGKEGLTLAGLLMFGKGLSVRERFSNFRMDYIDLTDLHGDMRYSDRLTYDGTWENNLYNFFRKVLTKLTSDLKRPFRL